MDFSGKVVLITGASGNVGIPTAKLFANLNASLVLVSKSEDALKAVAECCRARNGKKPLAIKIDLTKDGSCEEVIQRTLEAFGRLDVLVNFAGRLSLNSMFDENIDSFDETFKICLRVPYKLTHCALPYLVQTRGNVVNLRAQCDAGKPGYLNMAVINSAMDVFTKAAALDVIEAGVRINAVNVSLTETDVAEDLCDDLGKGIDLDYYERQREVSIMEPERVARMIAVVASGRYRSLSGANVYNA